jgi:hypothetical protein
MVAVAVEEVETPVVGSAVMAIIEQMAVREMLTWTVPEVIRYASARNLDLANLLARLARLRA